MGLPEDEASMDIPVPLPSRPTSFPRYNHITCIITIAALYSFSFSLKIVFLILSMGFFTLYWQYEKATASAAICKREINCDSGEFSPLHSLQYHV